MASQIVGKEFLTTATSGNFLAIQSGNNAQPYFYVEAIVSGATSVLADSYTSTNWLIDGGLIDRERPILPGERSSIFSADVTIKLDNSTRRFSPDVTGSVFFGQDYLESPVNYWAGFVRISGTAILLQRGAFVLEDLRLDSRETVAYFRLRDKFKRALDNEIGIAASGTAVELFFTGSLNSKTIIEGLLITGTSGLLTAGDLDIQTSLVGFNNISLAQQTVAQALALVSEASDGFMYTSRDGKITFRDNQPIFGTATTDFSISESNWAMNIFWEQTKDDRLKRVSVDFASGTSLFVVAESNQTANAKSISNDAIQGTGDAIALSTRILDRFSGQVTKLEIPSVYAPSLEIGNKISITSSGLGLNAKRFDLYKIQEEPTQGKMRLFLVNEDRVTGKWGFLSHQTGFTTAGETHSAVFAGSGATESGGWQAGWAFIAQTSGAETTAGFDTDGDNDGLIESGVTSSGAGGTGIEVGFMLF